MVILGAFAKLRKATIGFIMSIRLSARMEQVGSQRTDFGETWYLSFFRKCVQQFQDSLKSEKNSRNFIWRRFHTYNNISLNSS